MSDKEIELQIAQLLEENAQLKSTLQQVEEAGAAVDAQIAKIKSKYKFFRSNIPNCTLVLGDSSTVVFEPNSMVLSRNKATGKVESEEAWGQFYTKSPEVAKEIEAACKTNPIVRAMEEAEIDYVLESLRASYRTDQ